MHYKSAMHVTAHTVIYAVCEKKLYRPIYAVLGLEA